MKIAPLTLLGISRVISLICKLNKLRRRESQSSSREHNLNLILMAILAENKPN